MMRIRLKQKLWLLLIPFPISFAIIPIHLGCSGNEQASTQSSLKDDTLTDGPYIWRQEQKAIGYYVNAGKKQIINIERHFTVHVEGHPNWLFTIPLQNNLQPTPCEFRQPDKILLLSDIEGEFEVFRSLLIGNKVIDEHYHWIFGKGHLVVAGDLFDRGRNVTAFLWLLYYLEQQAKDAGGYVHAILGNHDVMNLTGNYRYVLPKYKKTAEIIGRKYGELYSDSTELGRWLRTKNIIEKIGDGIYLHGGISPAVNALQKSVAQINMGFRSALSAYKTSDSTTLYFNRKSPIWYRGYFMQPRARMNTIDSTLTFYHCNRIFVGHTILDRNICFYYGGKVMGVDVDTHAGKKMAALYQKGNWYTVDEKGNQSLLVYDTANDSISDEDIR